MPEYKVETLRSISGDTLQQKFNKEVEDKINEYAKNGYSLFSHQMFMGEHIMTVQLVFIKED